MQRSLDTAELSREKKMGRSRVEHVPVDNCNYSQPCALVQRQRSVGIDLRRSFLLHSVGWLDGANSRLHAFYRLSGTTQLESPA